MKITWHRKRLIVFFDWGSVSRQVVALMILSLCSRSVQAQSVFTSPVGGEELVSGTTQSISWNPKLLTGMLTFSLWDGGHGTWVDVFSSVPSEEGSLKWMVPEYLEGSKFRLKVSTTGAMQGSGLTRTFFSIVPPAHKVESSVRTTNSPIDMTVHPNPASNIARLCVPDLPAGYPVTIVVVNSAGVVVARLYDATPEASLGLCCTLDCESLPSGTYFARLWNDDFGKSVKLVIAR